MEIEGVGAVPLLVGNAIATFLAITSCYNTWSKSRDVENAKVEYWKDRALQAEQKADAEEEASRRDRDRLNQVILDMAELKRENGVMLEQLTQLRLTNANLNARIEQLLGHQNANT